MRRYFDLQILAEAVNKNIAEALPSIQAVKRKLQRTCIACTAQKYINIDVGGVFASYCTCAQDEGVRLQTPPEYLEPKQIRFATGKSSPKLTWQPNTQNDTDGSRRREPPFDKSRP